jgi:hypothetical protein
MFASFSLSFLTVLCFFRFTAIIADTNCDANDDKAWEEGRGLDALLILLVFIFQSHFIP